MISTASQLWLTDTVLDAPVSAQAKLIAAAVGRFEGKASYSKLTRLLPISRTNITPAYRELEAHGLMRVRPQQGGFIHANRFELVAKADARQDKDYFTRLTITDALGQSASRWVLRAILLREQKRTGAIQMPDETAAFRAGTSGTAVGRARRLWKARQVHARTKHAPAVFVLDDLLHPPEPERFQIGWRQLDIIEHDKSVISMFGSKEQIGLARHKINDGQTTLTELVRVAGNPADADLALNWLRKVQVT